MGFRHKNAGYSNGTRQRLISTVDCGLEQFVEFQIGKDFAPLRIAKSHVATCVHGLEQSEICRRAANFSCFGRFGPWNGLGADFEGN